jgi:hypothetical protein
MAVGVQRIEKEYWLKVLYTEKVPVVYLKSRDEYVLVLEKPTLNKWMYFQSSKVIPGLQRKQRLDLIFDYRKKTLSFFVQVISIRDNHIITDVPEMLYKDLGRSYTRVNIPKELQIRFAFLGDRYALNFPRIRKYEALEDIDEVMGRWNPKNLSGLVAQLVVRLREFANGYRFVLFKDIQPESTEERILAETGNALFIPSTLLPLPTTDPFPEKRLVVEETFRRYLESIGVEPVYIADEIRRFIRAKFEAGILSEAWVPILFQEYVIGYIQVWINNEAKPRFTHETIAELYQFSKMLAFSFKENGHFDSARLAAKPFTGKVVDISASGLLFAYPHSQMFATLLPKSRLSVCLSMPRRKITAKAEIVRRYKDATMGYFGCRFIDMVPEDMRFLFELIYGKPFTDSQETFLRWQV